MLAGVNHDVGWHILGEASVADPQLPAAYEPASVLWQVGFAMWPASQALELGCVLLLLQLQQQQMLKCLLLTAAHCTALAPHTVQEISSIRTFCSVMV